MNSEPRDGQNILKMAEILKNFNHFLLELMDPVVTISTNLEKTIKTTITAVVTATTIVIVISFSNNNKTLSWAKSNH